ncbi:MAG TPA: prephenate dehydrogenase/arogenate dehydrogenase family protein [Microthrixaceae bacterium]|nr:prephenate dehydrogenase/arogenate dehydrogenase family protein [Microthrixaceae bacterium]
MGRRALVIGTGLIGGSVGHTLRSLGWHVSGQDADDATAARALALGAVDAVGDDPEAELVVLATPVGSIVDTARSVLETHPQATVTDVGSVKAAVVAAVDSPRFVGGHPMAGSEQEGVEGASASMFDGAVWVLTPTPATDPVSYALVHSVASSFGADVITLDPGDHDEVVAVVSHVPHLTAATLMGLATSRSDEHSTMLRLAAGGFRDMTRIAAGHPGIWPDICAENRDAICSVLDALIDELAEVRAAVAGADRSGLLGRLEQARAARLNLPTTAARPDDLVELRVGVPDEPGQLAAVTATATALGVNIYDIEIAHSVEGPRGVLILVVGRDGAGELGAALEERGYHVGSRSLS